MTQTMAVAVICIALAPQTGDLLDVPPNTQLHLQDTLPPSPPWTILDEIREQHLVGNTDTALALLESLAMDTIVHDEEFINARREITSYILVAAGQHERAFDSLVEFTTSRIALLEREKHEVIEYSEAELLKLKLQLEEQQRRADEQVKALEYEHRVYLIGLGLLAFFLIVLLIALAWRRRRSSQETHIESSAIDASIASSVRPVSDIQPVPTPSAPTPVPVAASLPQPSGGPMDVVIMHAHTSAISKQLNQGATVEAAGHLGNLDRFLRLLTEQGPNGRTSVQQALALLRQYLKLEILRLGTPMRYSVDADRSLSDQVTIPVMQLATLLSKIVQGSAGTIGTQVNVELVPSDVGDEAQCIIKYPAITGKIISIPTIGIPDLVIDQKEDGPEIIMAVKWLVHQRA